jgi:imidazolonepropionase-like amidohydrolase
MLNGKSFNRYQFALSSPEAARSAVRLLKYLGVQGLEIERRVPRDVYFALIDEARKAGLPLSGKVPLDVSPAQASEAGQASIDNLETIYDGTFRAAHEENFIADISQFLEPGGGADALFATFRKNETAVTPVINAFHDAVLQTMPHPSPVPDERYVAASNRIPISPVPPAVHAQIEAEYTLLLKTVARLQSDGVMLLAGTDLAGSRVPGVTLPAELETLVAAGLSPMEALKTATLNPAKVMGLTDEYGTVTPGRIADLLLLDHEPIHDITAIRDIDAVVLRGRLLNRAALNGLLTAGAKCAAVN